MSADESRYDREEAPVRKSSGTSCLLWTLLLGVGGAVVCGVVCCGGLAYFGFNIMATEVEVAIRDNAQIREHLGDLQSVRLNFMKSVADEDGDTWVYDLTGSKGKGELTVVQTTGAAGGESFHSAKLRLADGTTVDIAMQPDENLIDQLKLKIDAATPADKPVDPTALPTITEPIPTDPAAPAETSSSTPTEPAKPE